MRKNRQAQNTLEYSVFIVCLVAGFIAMKCYLIRGLQGKITLMADEIGSQYAPRATSSDMLTTYAKDTTSNFRVVNATSLAEEFNKYNLFVGLDDKYYYSLFTENIESDLTQRQGYETISAYDNESQ